jgi:hypothetical protein
MTSEGLGEIFEGDYADMCADKFPLVLMGCRADDLACADLGGRTPIGTSGICNCRTIPYHARKSDKIKNISDGRINNFQSNQ